MGSVISMPVSIEKSVFIVVSGCVAVFELVASVVVETESVGEVVSKSSTVAAAGSVVGVSDKSVGEVAIDSVVEDVVESEVVVEVVISVDDTDKEADGALAGETFTESIFIIDLI